MKHPADTDRSELEAAYARLGNRFREERFRPLDVVALGKLFLNLTPSVYADNKQAAYVLRQVGLRALEVADNLDPEVDPRLMLSRWRGLMRFLPKYRGRAHTPAP